MRDPRCRELALRRVTIVAEDAGFRVLQTADAPRSHPHGNREIFIDLGWATEQAKSPRGSSTPGGMLQPHRPSIPQASMHGKEGHMQIECKQSPCASGRRRAWGTGIL